MRILLSVLMSAVLLFSIQPINADASYSNKPINWGFKRSKDHQPPSAGKQLDELLAEYGSFYLGDTSKKEVYLTFDNGYENGYTGKVLDVLKKKNVPATFFVTGHFLDSQPKLVERMAKEGHIVGNHSWYHPDLTQVSDERLKRELDTVRDEIERITGEKGGTYLRPPRGVFSERTLALSEKYGYQNVFWSLAFVDWHIDQQKGWEYAYNNIMKQIHPGAILLLHTVSKDNAEALEKAITDLEKEGYTFKSLDHLMVKQFIDEPLILNIQ
ncbi:peptidoglycan-N-acetylmuramic acid deacetylase [Bacillus luteolus]|nr:peptidoglycan-N-acetylmuramic acid deacetylase [Cytobacillus luteolus]